MHLKTFTVSGVVAFKVLCCMVRFGQGRYSVIPVARHPVCKMAALPIVICLQVVVGRHMVADFVLP